MMDNTLELTGSSKISTNTLVRISKLELKNSSNNVETSSSVDGNIKGIMETIFTGSGTAMFTGTVVNMGSTEAVLSTINLLNESNNSSPTCIIMSIDGLKVGDTLTPSQEQNFTVTLTSICTESSTKTNEFSLSYIPVNPSEGTTTIDERFSNLENQITALQTENTSLKNQVSTLSTTVNNNKILNAYPVGSIYISTSSTNPGNFIGGTWEQIKDDAYLKIVAENSGVLDGTSKDHKIPISSMPSHNHPTENFIVNDANTNKGRILKVDTAGEAVLLIANYNVKTNEAGGSEPYYPYYYGVYLWKRTK